MQASFERQICKATARLTYFSLKNALDWCRFRFEISDLGCFVDWIRAQWSKPR